MYHQKPNLVKKISLKKFFCFLIILIESYYLNFPFIFFIIAFFTYTLLPSKFILLYYFTILRTITQSFKKNTPPAITLTEGVFFYSARFIAAMKSF